MYNFKISSQLKAWIDRVLVAGKTFRYTPDGPEGLAGDKRVIVAIARGGFYDGWRPSSISKPTSGVFNFLGIEPEFVPADGLAVGPEQRDAGSPMGWRRSRGWRPKQKKKKKKKMERRRRSGFSM